MPLLSSVGVEQMKAQGKPDTDDRAMIARSRKANEHCYAKALLPVPDQWPNRTSLCRH